MNEPIDITVQVRFFASLREALGAGQTVSVAAGSSLGALRAQLRNSSRQHAEVLAADRPVRGAVDQVLADDTAALHDGAEVAFFPPVTGG